MKKRKLQTWKSGGKVEIKGESRRQVLDSPCLLPTVGTILHCSCKSALMHISEKLKGEVGGDRYASQWLESSY